MALACNEDHIALLGQHHGRANCCRAIRNAQVARSDRHPLLHLVENRLGIFVARVVGRENRRRSVRGGNACHLGALLAVAVTPATTHHKERTLRRANLVDRLQDILQRIGRVGIIDHTDHLVSTTDALETTAHGLQQTQRLQDLFAFEAQLQRRGIDPQEVRGVEATRQRAPQLASVEFEQHPIQVHLYEFTTVVGHRAQRVAPNPRPCILHHHPTVAIIHIRQGKCPLRECIEEALFGLQILGKGLVVVEVVVREVGKKSTRKVQPISALLYNGVRRTLHEAVVASGIDHLAQHPVQANRIGGCMGRGHLSLVDLIDHGRDQPRTVAQLTHQLIEERRGSRFAVRTRHTDQLQLAARIIVEGRGHAGHRPLAILHQQVGHLGMNRQRQLLAHHRRSTALDRHRNKAMTIRSRSSHGKEAAAACHLTRVEAQIRNLHLRRTGSCHHRHILQHG